MHRSVVYSRTIAGIGLPPVFINEQRRPERIRRTLKGSGLVRNAPIIPQYTVKIVFFQQAQILVSVGSINPSTVFLYKCIPRHGTPLAEFLKILFRDMHKTRIVSAACRTPFAGETQSICIERT
jgi:hypothetical protein